MMGDANVLVRIGHQYGRSGGKRPLRFRVQYNRPKAERGVTDD